ncbi:rhamnan synthesis F family protein [Microbacterium sp. zg-Y625]|uniref:rhamnan synthesis F family protein n=2 Tax=Microbacterium jiangjiandongii TaxID=3049071 RepID=UPI002550C44B|nr:rhamnan synthesis F family protein [Microbacterium sp. zg-Y625]WIM26090.1 rhamnan synthesis F family protein [Microbacterium sp. zg-Y625]
MSGVGVPVAFPVGGRRLVVYVVWDRRGGVEDYIPVALAGLREHAARILVVVNGELSAEGRAKLEPVCDEVLVRENRGFDIWAHKDALDHLGSSVAEFDEVVFANDTWYGPVRPFGPVFERMDAQPVHFWGMTDHAREVPNPFTGSGVLPYHLQSFWIAVRREMLGSSRWREYWAALPEMPGYFDAVLKHEVVFTEHFAEAGYIHQAAFPSAGYPSDHPALFNVDLMLDDGCPLVKRRPLFHYPPFLDRHAVIGRELIARIAREDYPVEVVMHDLARNVAPRVLIADAGLVDVVGEDDAPEVPAWTPRVTVILNLGGPAAATALRAALTSVPAPYRVVATVPRQDMVDEVAAILRDGAAEDVEVRVVPSGPDFGDALWVGCRDVLVDPTRDLIVRLRDDPCLYGREAGAVYLRRHDLESLLGGPGVVTRLYEGFHREPGLGAVFPVRAHIGRAVAGLGWGEHWGPAQQLFERMGVRVPVDPGPSVGPSIGAWIARPQALALLTEVTAEPEDDSLGETLARAGGDDLLLAPFAAERGYHVRTVLSPQHAAIAHSSIDYAVDQLSTTLPGYPLEQIQFLHRVQWDGNVSVRGILKMYLNMNRPGLMQRVRRAAHAARRVRDIPRRLRARVRRGR